MNEQIDLWLNNPYILALANFSVAALAMLVFLAIFELVTVYKAYDEIRRGNVAVALTISGKIFAIANVFRFAIESHESVYVALLWASFGFVLLLIAYFMFEFLTPFKVDKHIEQGNAAVGLISFIISVSLSYIVGASIP